MIALLTGTVAGTGPDSLIVDVQGVGYRVQVPSPMVLGASHGEPTTVHVSTVVREDAFLLYGFASAAERDAFDLLRSVSKVGPKHALSLLSTLPLADLARAIAGGDTRALSRAPGIGKRTAERLCLELESKLPAEFQVAAATGDAAPRPADPADPLPLALAQLGYRKSEIDRAMAASAVPDYAEAAVEQRLSAALRVLAQA
jgi:Holliday junction DNA helicase RuvA